MPKPFKLYRIICTITDKALVSGSDKENSFNPNGYPRGERLWHERGYWSPSDGMFWKSETTVRRHLHNLCHDWMNKSAPYPTSWGPSYAGVYRYWTEIIPGSRDWSRLQHLSVEQFHITDYSAVKLKADDFMGVNAILDDVNKSARERV